ncbi:hypothetical protein IQ249_11670 [Lusitaniella coriacea LEGE 07157]|uniref:Ycf66 family protein n=1 Tax=Lusitaniella coriacea LEGE 07157 TaxID=945747 RepID=A0A8J7DWV6_9CYAN|nr:hypothetical protein [Lusitaniella coriacea]MBE9116558.1 hypothetical protein [Lusitaniella coriacea LEGE 07157]
MNVGSRLGTLIGLLYILLAFGYFIVMIIAIARSSNNSFRNTGLYIIQSVVIPILLFLPGVILLWSGWRLQPSLEFAQVLQAIAVIYLTLRDAFVKFSR